MDGYSEELLDLIPDSTLSSQLEKHEGKKLIRERTRKILDFPFPVVSAKRVQCDAVLRIFRNCQREFLQRAALRAKLRDACPFLIKLVYLSGRAACFKNTAKVPSNARLSYFASVSLIL